MHEGDAIEVAISDRGHGIVTEQAAALFESFFTTKEDGMGLGLGIAQSIVERHGGRIWAQNNRDGGATFHFSVPVDRRLVPTEGLEATTPRRNPQQHFEAAQILVQQAPDQATELHR
jgi:K+-sensing histidine kinase KdpD